MSLFGNIYHSDLSSKAISVYMYLRDRADKEMKCFPGLKTIARDMGCSVSTVQRAVKELEKQEYIKKENRFRDNGGKTSNMYYVLK